MCNRCKDYTTSELYREWAFEVLVVAAAVLIVCVAAFVFAYWYFKA
jgi:hypothetical protein